MPRRAALRRTAPQNNKENKEQSRMNPDSDKELSRSRLPSESGRKSRAEGLCARLCVSVCGGVRMRVCVCACVCVCVCVCV